MKQQETTLHLFQVEKLTQNSAEKSHKTFIGKSIK